MGGSGMASAASRRGRPAAARAGRPWPAGLPVPLTPLVGRRREVAEVRALVAGSRLVTLTGPGGVGKTRLAIEAGAGLAGSFGDGCDLVDLSAVPDPGSLLGAVCMTLGVEERDQDGLAERLARILRPQHRLVILDNCEHLASACAALSASLLGTCPRLAILATSRQRLGVPGETTWRVPSLGFPPPGPLPLLSQLESFDAVALFVARAREVRAGFAIGSDDVAAVISICSQLDGIPLALELAAARAGALGVGEIADRLGGRLELLASTADGAARHRTLRASVEWSCQLLTVAELALFRRLAVFAGGWTLDAAEAVCAATPVRAQDAACLLASLVDKSLIQVEWSAAGTRYRLLEAVKVVAAEQLAEAGELVGSRARHAEYFADVGERSAALLLAPDQARWARRLDAERDNLRAARRWCTEDPARSDVGLRLASGLWEYWQVRGMLDEGIEWLRDSLCRAAGPVHARAAALNGLGVLSQISGDLEGGTRCFRESISLYEQADDLACLSRAWAHLGAACTNAGDRPGSAQAIERSLALARGSAAPWHVAFALFMSGYVAAAWDDVALAVTHLRESAEMFAQIGDRRGVAYSQVGLGGCLVRQGDWPGSLSMLREAIQIFDAFREPWAVLYGISQLTAAVASSGDWRQVAFLLGVADTLSERIGGQLQPPMQTAADAAAGQADAALGAETEQHRHAGRVVGRSDGVAAALWPGQAAARTPPDSEPRLTRRELEVATLIAEGLTNRQIGGRLVIAERTVDAHVSRVLAKLGCASRAQIAAIIAARDAVHPPASMAVLPRRVADP